MTFEEFKAIAKTLNAIYEDKGALMFETKEKMLAWYACLKDLDYEILSKAVKNHMLTSKFKPTIPELREAYARLVLPQYPTAQEAWAIVRDGIRGSVPFEDLPEIIQAAVVDKAQLWEWGQCESKQVDTVIQGLFKKAYEVTVQRRFEDAVLGDVGARAGTMIEAHEQFKLEVKEDAEELQEHFEVPYVQGRD